MKYLVRIVCCAAPLLFAAGICQAANQTGALLEIKGTVSQSSGDSTVSRDVDLLVPDAKIHSGAPQTSPCDNISSDSYVLQGGSPTGCDNEGEGTSSTFETSQSPGTYTFKAAATSTQAGYQFDIQTFYTTEGCSYNQTCANPDTGFLQVTNSGPSNFAGTISLSGNPGNTDAG